MRYLLNASNPVPLHRQLYESVRRDVLRGIWRPGQKLPSSREWSATLGVSRTTILTALDQLRAEGYIEARLGAEVRVSEKLPEEFLKAPSVPKRTTTQHPAAATRSPGAFTNPRNYGPPKPFQMAVPALDLFPHRAWGKLTTAIWRNPPPELLNHPEPGGHTPLRHAVARYLRAERGIECESEQVILTAGSQQALQLAARILIRQRPGVWIENPGYYAARIAFEQAGGMVHPVPVDEQGLDVAAGKRIAPKATLAYVTPSHQCPMGVRLSLERRIALLEWASAAGAWILEDDYDSEFRYQGRPLATLHSLDGGNRVIYVGTFSLLLYPALRIGYLVVPPALVDAFRAARALADWSSPAVDQAVLAEFLEKGMLHRHLRRMRKLYAARQQHFLEQARQKIGEWVEFHPHSAGLHVLGTLKKHQERDVIAAATEQGIFVRPLGLYTMGKAKRQGLLFGFAPFHEEAVSEGLNRLREVFGKVGR